MKILFYVEAKKSLGHATRSIEIAHAIMDMDNNADITFILDTEFTKPFEEFRTIMLPVSDDGGSFGGSIPKGHSLNIKRIIDDEQPDCVIFDTFFPSDILASLECKKVLVMRKYRDTEMQKFLDNKYYELFDKIIVPHEDVGKLPTNFIFVGPIVKSVKKRAKKSGFKILVACGGGGFDDIERFVNTSLDVFDNIDIPELEFTLVTGPFNKTEIRPRKGLIVKKYDDNLIDSIQDSDLVICQAGYNTINEIILTRTPAIIMPGFRNNDDQEERADSLKIARAAYVVVDFDADIARKRVMNLYDNPNKLKEMSKNYDSLMFEKGNKAAAKEILNLKDKNFRLTLGNKCNNNCTYCNNKKDNFVRIKQDINRLAKGYNALIMPCNSDMREDFFDIISDASKIGLKIILETNGRMFYYERFTKKTAEYIDRFDVYLNGTERTHNEISGTDSYRQTLAGIKNLILANADIRMITEVTKDNCQNLKEIQDLKDNIGIREWDIRYRDNQDGMSIEYFSQIIADIYPARFTINGMDYPDFKQHILKTTGYLPLPRKLTFEPTAICNLHCKMCERYKTPEQKGNELSLDEIRCLIDELPETIKRIFISGGEPLMRHDIGEICRLFKDKEYDVCIQTNGTFVDRTLRLVKSGVDVIFSLDGLEEVHDKIRGRSGVYKKNIEIFKALKDMEKKIVITTVVTDYNLLHIPKIFSELESMKPLFIIELERRFTKELITETAEELYIEESSIPMHIKGTLIPKYTFNEFNENLSIIDRELKRFKFKHYYYPRQLIENRKDFYFRTYRKNNNLCCSQLDELRIDSEGNVTPCFVIRKNFGNIKNKPISEIWNSNKFREYRMQLMRKNLSSVCETCFRAVDKKRYSDYLKDSSMWRLNEK